MLGDVVCGGFAAPMRSGHAELIWVVTSGEAMSLYAANNIARGIRSHAEQGDVRMGGIIANVKDLDLDRGLVERFAESIGTRVQRFVEWDRSVREAERRRTTVIRHRPDAPDAATWRDLADAIEEAPQPHIPEPMDDRELDLFLREAADAAEALEG